LYHRLRKLGFLSTIIQKLTAFSERLIANSVKTHHSAFLKWLTNFENNVLKLLTLIHSDKGQNSPFTIGKESLDSNQPSFKN